MGWEGVEQRRFPRAHYACIVRVRVKGSVEVFQTATENIGCGGICVMLPKGLAVFSPVETELDFEQLGKKVICDGKIVWSVRKSQIETTTAEEFDTGIEFLHLNKEDTTLIEKVVGECLKKNTSSKSAS